ncbi:MAG TPA: tail fiber protein [Desulfuromonadaceae bacterium]
MAEPFIGEIRLFGFNFAPQYWATCDGQLLNISQNQALFALLGTTYGGNGTTNFNLPDLRGRTMLHRSTTDPMYLEGKGGGTETVTLTATSQLPAHTHQLNANSAPGGANVPSNNVPAAVATANQFAYATAKASPATVLPSLTSTGGAAHSNTQPSLTVNYCIALSGIFPSRG